ncbi:MAG: cell wall hydrolase [Sphingomonadales bacterium]|nr:cell wall hydrolase [Sphingomonadales bacterium]MBU3993695.1 cell wall hydrolase [Alphaproteobacteria bacterium]
MSVDDRTQIIAEGTDAESRNAAIPFAAGANAPMRGFLLHASAPAAATALKCLTQAIYYEAATEPVAGRRAVAQVVLNRMRHPAYPKSVCGVVYQGAERATGCQFSFTCDGSLLRQPMAGPWREAEGIAQAALAGRVEPSVGTATFYHADYVLPRWAFELAKVNKLGRHLFYRFTGAGGRPGKFNGQYSAQESIPAFDLARLQARLLAAGNPADGLADTVPGLTVAPHVTDRHASDDVGGRLDVTRAWRLTIPDPAESSSRYRALVSGADAGAPPQTGGSPAAAEIAQ